MAKPIYYKIDAFYSQISIDFKRYDMTNTVNYIRNIFGAVILSMWSWEPTPPNLLNILRNFWFLV